MGNIIKESTSTILVHWIHDVDFMEYADTIPIDSSALPINFDIADTCLIIQEAAADIKRNPAPSSRERVIDDERYLLLYEFQPHRPQDNETIQVANWLDMAPEQWPEDPDELSDMLQIIERTYLSFLFSMTSSLPDNEKFPFSKDFIASQCLYFRDHPSSYLVKGIDTFESDLTDPTENSPNSMKKSENMLLLRVQPIAGPVFYDIQTYKLLFLLRALNTEEMDSLNSLFK